VPDFLCPVKQKIVQSFIGSNKSPIATKKTVSVYLLMIMFFELQKLLVFFQKTNHLMTIIKLYFVHNTLRIIWRKTWTLEFTVTLKHLHF